MESKVVVVTGARKGLGKMLAEYFLSEGHYVYGMSRKRQSIEHSRYMHFTLDVNDEGGVVQMIRHIYKERGHIDILINNAGIASMNHFLLTPYETAQNIMNTNFFGTFLMCREVSKIMSKRKTGKIINFSSVAVPLNLEGELAYSASKAAVEQLTRVLARELAPNNICVNAVGPTPIATDLIATVPKEKIEKLLSRQSFNRLGKFEDVLAVVKFFASEEAHFITGQIIYLGGVN